MFCSTITPTRMRYLGSCCIERIGRWGPGTAGVEASISDCFPHPTSQNRIHVTHPRSPGTHIVGPWVIEIIHLYRDLRTGTQHIGNWASRVKYNTYITHIM